MQTNYEVVVIGGSYAGLSAAMALGRASRKTLVIDSGLPCNRHTPHSHNFLTRDGETPEELRKTAIEQVTKYPTITLLRDKVTYTLKKPEGFEITTDTGQHYQGKKVLFATGIYDLLPQIEGFEDCWGISAVHCPYCHGYEFRGQKTGILAAGDAAYHYAIMLSQWTKDLTIFSEGKSGLTVQQTKTLSEKNISVIEEKVCCIMHNKGYISNVMLKDGTKHTLTALYHKPDFIQHTDLPEKMGCIIEQNGYIQTDFLQKTSVDGIFAAGDCASPMRSVANAVAAGSKAGAAINMELCQASFESGL